MTTYKLPSSSVVALISTHGDYACCRYVKPAWEGSQQRPGKGPADLNLSLGFLRRYGVMSAPLKWIEV